MVVTNPGQTLAPSEVVYLTADQFLQKAEMPKQHLISFQTSLFPLPEGGMGVSKQPLAELACMAAFLALQAAGGVRLEIRATKALFGLRTTQMLYVTPCAAPAPWPEASLESAIQAAARSLQAAAQNEAGNIVYGMFGADNYDPFGWVCERVRDGLARRGLLTDEDYRLTPPAGAAAAAQFGETKALLVECQHGHADLWDVLHTRVWQAVRRREASSSDR